MKINIDSYKNFFGPYQLADLLQYFGVSEDNCHKIGEKLSKTFIGKFLIWIDSKRKRKTKIKIDDYDIWNMDYTLSLIILPMLIKMRSGKSGIPFVYDVDVPDNLKNNDADYLVEKWNYVLDEMIFAFKSKKESWQNQFISGVPNLIFENINVRILTGPKDTFKIDFEGQKAYQARISNGFRLFGKYYESLWT